jgi:hypothetical protein
VVRLGAVDVNPAGHGLFAIDSAVAILEAWRVRPEARGVVNDQVLVQIVERARRPVLPEISGAGTVDHRQFTEATRG